jgi:two-component system LytT family sensor kinase
MGKLISFSDKWIKVTLHTIFWIIVILISHYLINSFAGGNVLRLYGFYLHTFSYAFIFYVGYLWLVPRYFVQNKQLTYFLILIAIILATHYGTNYIDRTFLTDPVADARFREAMKMLNGKGEDPKNAYLFGIISYLFTSLLLSGFAIGLGVMEKLKQNEKKQKELEKEKLHSELAFLKNQVSPHFFFNTLNNIYSLIGIDGPTAQDSVLKLSKLMRYLLYESEHGETLMSHEIDFMNNYIDLMKLRLSPRVELEINFPKEFSDFTVPFVENAFKHGVSHRDRSFIHIRMTIENDQINFVSKNSNGKSSQPGDMQHSGIGLENVKKRLHLLFPDNHELTIEQNETVFHVELTINKTKV